MKTYVRDERYKHIVKQWIALNVCSDWLLRLQIFFAIHLRATNARLVINQNNYLPQCRW